MTIGRFAVVTVALVTIGVWVLDWWLHRDDGIVEQGTAFEDVRFGRRAALYVLFAALAPGGGFFPL